MKQWIRLASFLLLVGLLVVVRMVEYRFFYDPFMHFYQDPSGASSLSYSFGMFFRVVLRFLLNTGISLAILFVVFQKWSIVRFAALVYLFTLILLYPLFVYFMMNIEPSDYLAAFYVRRFLVHPVLILILLPAFYYNKIQGGQK